MKIEQQSSSGRVRVLLDTEGEYAPRRRSFNTMHKRGGRVILLGTNYRTMTNFRVTLNDREIQGLLEACRPCKTNTTT